MGILAFERLDVPQQPWGGAGTELQCSLEGWDPWEWWQVSCPAALPAQSLLSISTQHRAHLPWDGILTSQHLGVKSSPSVHLGQG